MFVQRRVEEVQLIMRAIVLSKPKSTLSESVNGLSKYLINNVHPNAACSYNHESSCHWNDIVDIS